MEVNFGGPALCGLVRQNLKTEDAPFDHQTSPHKAGPPVPLLRRAPVHHSVVEFGNQSVIVFLTVCTERRQPILANKIAHELIVSAWDSAPTWKVGKYVIMPDHIHLFAAPNTLPPSSLHPWVAQWKAYVSRQLPRPLGSKVWQKNFWDTQLRQGESYSAKWEYVRENPVRASLVATPEEWPFQGELNILPWHDR